MMHAIVVGASSGIGRGLARRLAAAGWTVGLVGRREELLREAAQECSPTCRYTVADVMRPRESAVALECLADRLGGMDLCIVAAGTGELNPALDFALEEPAIRTNVLGWTAVVDWAWERFERQGRGHLVVVSSVAGLRGSAVAPAYNATKAYQINYTEGLRMKAAGSGLPIAVTDIRPGLVATAMAKGDGLFWVMPLDRTCDQIMRAIRRRSRVTIVTRLRRRVAWMLRRLPERIYLKMG